MVVMFATGMTKSVILKLLPASLFPLEHQLISAASVLSRRMAAIRFAGPWLTFQGAGDQLQLLRADFAEVLHTVVTFRAAGFRWLQPVYLARKVFR